MSCSGDEDIIEATPQKITKYSKKKPKKTGTIQKHSHDEYIINPIKKFIPDNELMNPTCSTHFNKPYVYYSIQEVRKITKNNLLNSYISTVGIYRISNDFGHYIADYNSSQKTDKGVPLNFKYVTNIPKEGEILSVYGCLEDSIFVIKFYRVELKAVVDKYIQNLNFIRNFIPNKYLINTA